MVDDNNPVDSDSLLAALPVGAREAIFSSTSLSDILLILLYASIIAFTIVVFPVPGPPVIIKTLLLLLLFVYHYM